MATLNDVHIDKPIDVIPYINDGNGHSDYIKCEGENSKRVTLNSEQANLFIQYLLNSNNQNLIEESLQSLSERKDGTLLKTAFPTIKEVWDAIKDIDLSVFGFLVEELKKWEKQGCNEVFFEFEEN